MLRLIRFFRHSLQAKPSVALAVGLGVFAASAAWTFTRPKIYEATASVTFGELRRGPLLADDDDKIDEDVAGISTRFTDLRPAVLAASGDLFAKNVADKLTPAEIADISPHPIGSHPDELLRNLKAARRVTPYYLSSFVAVSFRNRNPATAYRVATLFAKELQTWAKDRRDLGAKADLEELRRKIEAQDQRVKTLERRLEAAASPSLSDNMESERDVLKRLIENRDQRSRLKGALHRLDTGFPPALDDYVEPNRPRHLALGLLAGLVLGPTSAAFAAHAKTRRPPVPAA